MCAGISLDAELLFFGKRIEVGKMLRELEVGYMRKVVPNCVGGAAAMCLPEVKNSCYLMPVRPPSPASFVA